MKFIDLSRLNIIIKEQIEKEHIDTLFQCQWHSNNMVIIKTCCVGKKLALLHMGVFSFIQMSDGFTPCVCERATQSLVPPLTWAEVFASHVYNTNYRNLPLIPKEEKLRFRKISSEFQQVGILEKIRRFWSEIRNHLDLYIICFNLVENNHVLLKCFLFCLILNCHLLD